VNADDALRAHLWETMLVEAGETHLFEIERERLQAGKSFSGDSLDVLVASVTAWIGTRIMRRWNATNEPPTHLRVEVTVSVG